ncbi:MAG: SDR family NAD(P)-dependent oxidoreductase [Xanthomonadales bacterium]|nr:SDR family NAD(P)-dependent oxidoreductase [Xanthomonadales bacterium]
MKELKGRVAVVTGAGSGIGRAVAAALAEEGMQVAATDVDPAAAKRTCQLIGERGGSARSYGLDVADKGSIENAAERITGDLGLPSVLVNNAGIAVGGYFLDTSPESWDRIIAINLMGVVHCCRAFVPAMAAGGAGGQVVNIASMLGYFGARGVSAYCATKFGVVGFSECLRAELRDHGIGVTAICPGVVRTNIIQSGVLESATEDVEAKRALIDRLYRKRNYSPERVARAVVRAIRRNRAVAPVTPEAWTAYYLKRWTPWLARWIARRDAV